MATDSGLREQKKVRHGEDAIASTRDAAAPRKVAARERRVQSY